MPVIRWSSFLALVVFAVACSDATAAPTAGYTHAAAVAACGPADGPAVTIYLSPYPVEVQSPPPPFISIYINQAVEQIGGKTWTIGTSTAAATLRLTADSVETATAGSVVTSSVSADKTIDGSADLTFPSGHFIGVFHAVWISLAAPPCV
jgi:PBP1b-binding outer membrane lipoprotein LpoB